MESDWIKADFKTASQLEGAGADRLRVVNESLARDLAMNLSAYLRTSVTVGYAGISNVAYSDFLKDEDNSCFTAVLTRPGEHKLLVRADYAVLFPLIGIALGAKAGAFTAIGRKPTEIELQVVTLLFRLILAETYRAWAPVIKTQLETLTLEVEPTPARVLPAAALMCATAFDIAVAESPGRFVIAAPAGLFAEAVSTPAVEAEVKPDPGASSETILELMMSARVHLEVSVRPSEIRLADLLHLQVGQIVKLDHRAEQRVVATLNGQVGFEGQIVSTGARRGFLIEE